MTKNSKTSFLALVWVKNRPFLHILVAQYTLNCCLTLSSSISKLPYFWILLGKFHPPKPRRKLLSWFIFIFFYGFCAQIILWCGRHLGKLFLGGVISQKKKFLAWHSWPKQSKIGGPKSKPCKISPMTAFSVIFLIFPGAFHIFTTLSVVLRS